MKDVYPMYYHLWLSSHPSCEAWTTFCGLLILEFNECSKKKRSEDPLTGSTTLTTYHANHHILEPWKCIKYWDDGQLSQNMSCCNTSLRVINHYMYDDNSDAIKRVLSTGLYRWRINNIRTHRVLLFLRHRSLWIVLRTCAKRKRHKSSKSRKMKKNAIPKVNDFIFTNLTGQNVLPWKRNYH